MDEKINIKEYCYFPKVEENISFVGLRIEKNSDDNKRFKFNFPICYYTQIELENISTENIRNDIQNLLKAIYKTRVSETYSNINLKEKICPIDSYLWLIRDYLEKGYYVEYENTYNKGFGGKINWNKTIKNNSIAISKNFDLVYSEYISTKNMQNTENIVTTIHKYCVYDAFSKFGFIFGYDANMVEKTEINLNKEQMIQELKKEYINSFLDYKKELIINMINLLEWLNNKNLSYDMFSIESNKFELVFQNLVNERFGNVEQINEYYPIAKWHIKGTKTEEQGESASHLREDTILDMDKIYIIDSKYYKYEYHKLKNIEQQLPHTSDIAKQVIYGQYVRKKYNKDICNVFIIPCNDEKKYIEYIGFACMEYSENDNKKDYVYTLKIDLKTLVNNSFGTKNKNIEELVKVINEIV